MLKLLKYEFRKTWATKAVILILCALLEILFVVGLKTDKNDLLGWGASLLFMTAVFGSMVIGLQSVVTLHRDMNTRQGYMLFMTPHSSYAILGAKVLECALSLIVTGVFFLALGVLDVSLLFGHYDLLDFYVQQLKMLFAMSSQISIDYKLAASIVFMLCSAWLNTISCAYFSDVVSSALLNGKRFNGIITFILFILINYAIAWIMNELPMPADYMAQILIQGAVRLGFTVIMYAATATIMDRKLSV